MRAHTRANQRTSADDALSDASKSAAVRAASDAAAEPAAAESERLAEMGVVRENVAQAQSLMDEIEEAADDMDCSRCDRICQCRDGIALRSPLNACGACSRVSSRYVLIVHNYEPPACSP